jgi:hypothetical protein
MPKFTKTPLGKELSGLDGRTSNTKISKSNCKYGILFKSVNGLYIFQVKILDRKGNIVDTTGPIPLIEPPHDLAARYGSPEEMENNYMVRIDYTGSSVDRGWATVMKSLVGGNQGKEYEEVQMSNELAVKGTTFAPPGSGMV